MGLLEQVVSLHSPTLHSRHHGIEGCIIIVEYEDVEREAGEEEESLEKSVDLALLPVPLLALHT